MPRPVVALDADVLVPILACDFLLTAFEHGLFEPVVSTEVLNEVERALLTDLPHLDPTAIGYRVDAMRDALDDHLIDGDLMDVPGRINMKDRHVVAAALTGEASVLVTNDRRLRDEADGAHLPLQAMSLDDFAVDLWQRAPEGLPVVINALISKRTNPPITREVLLRALQNLVPTLTLHLR